MSKTDEHKKYITLDDVRVSYRKKDDTIHLTTTDPDVQAGGFHLSLNRGTQTEITLRDLLIEEGVIRNDVLIPIIQPNVFIAPPSENYRLQNSLPGNGNMTVSTTASKGGVGKTNSIFLSAEEQNQKGRVISVVSSKGGVGKTNISLALAAGLRKTGLSVVLVDLDVRDGQLGYYAGVNSPSMLNYYIDGEKSFSALQKSLVHDKTMDIDLLLAPKRARNADILGASFYTDIITQLKREYDIVLIDTAVDYLNEVNNTTLALSDIILFISNLSHGSLIGMDRWFQEVSQPVNNNGGMQLDLSRVGVIFNQTVPEMNLDLDRINSIVKEGKVLTSLPSEHAILRANSTQELAEAYQEKNEFNSTMKSLVRILAQAAH